MKFIIFDQSIKSHQLKKIDLKKVANVFQSFLSKNKHFLGVNEVNLNLTICGNAKILKLNSEYRSKNKVTDVLSFGVHENLRSDSGPFEKNLPVMELGDIVICKNVAKKQAIEFKISYEMEVIHLMAHGFLHLLGYDHELSKKEEMLMEKFEQKLVKEIYKSLGLSKGL